MGVSGKEGGVYLSVCLSAFLSETTFPGASVSPLALEAGYLQPETAPILVHKAGVVQGPTFQDSRPGV